MLTFEPEVADANIFKPLLAWWLGLEASTGCVPSRADLRPEDLPATAFSHLVLLEFVDGYNDAIFHLVGDHIRSMSHLDWKGKRASELVPADYLNGYLKPLHNEVVRLRRPVRTVTNFERGISPELIIARLTMPLRGEEQDIRYILSALSIHHADKYFIENDDAWKGIEVFSELERVVY